MGAPARGRKAVLLGLLALIPVLGLAALFWPEAVAEYHARRIAADPAVLAQAIDAPAGSGLERGLFRYLRLRDGRSLVFDSFLDLFQEAMPAFPVHVARYWSEFEISVGPESVEADWSLPGDRYPRSSFRMGGASGKLKAVAARLGTLEGARIESTRYPAWVFQVLPTGGDHHGGPRFLHLRASRVGPREDPPPLEIARALKTGTREARFAVVKALAEIGPEGLPILLGLTRDAEPQVISAAVTSIEWTVQNFEAAIARLQSLQSDGDQATHAWASDLLRRLDPERFRR